MISKKRLLTIVSLLIVVAFLNTGLFAAFSDVENSANNKISAYTPKMWKSTTEDDFYNNTTKFEVHTLESPGDVTLAEKETAMSSLYLLAGGNTRDFYRYYTESNNWSQRANVPANVGYGGSMAFDESRYIYAMMGGGTRHFWRFDTQYNNWSKRADTPGPVGAGGFLRNYNDGMFYALQGGNTGTLWKYNPSNDTWWTLTTTLPKIGETNAYGASMVVYLGFIYIVRSTASPTNTNVFYQVSLDGITVTPITITNPANKGFGLGVSITHGQGAYLLIGRGGDNREVYQYSITTKAFTKLGLVPKNSKLNVGSDLAYDNIRPFVTAGGNTNILLKYNSTLRTWATMTSMPSPVKANFGSNLLYVAFATGYAPSGYLVSSVHDTGKANMKLDSLFADYTVPSGTSISFKVRASNTRTWIPTPDDPNNQTGVNGSWDLTGVAWTTVTGSSISTITGQYVQWRVDMTTTVTTSTPILYEVRLYYRGF
ncbi:MAG TPA: hypothetical protein PLC39_03305 [Methanomassiliicoccales archaeon]|nr:hypothetical protein [Methanomassiliicoccales archaeon]HNX48101.1 hypothetical protein [Methanomassiliicoccales archaeon]HPR98307.1 hypothetical protein [Methanomassiliicoccales archaeon]